MRTQLTDYIENYFEARESLNAILDLGGTYIEDGRDREWAIQGDNLVWESLIEKPDEYSDDDWNYSSNIVRDNIKRNNGFTVVLVDDYTGDGNYWVILDNSKEIK